MASIKLRLRSRHAVAVAVLAMALSSACSSSGGEATSGAPTLRAGSTVAASSASSSSTTTASATTSTILSTTSTTLTSTTVDQDAALRSAVRAFWDLYLELGGATGPFDGETTRARLAERTSGAELNRLLAYFSSNAAAGYEVRGTVEVAPTVIAITGDAAQVSDCYDDATGLYRIGDGSRIDADNALRHQVLMTFVLEDGVWKVSKVADEGDGCTV
jgi:hypothetical protein